MVSNYVPGLAFSRIPPLPKEYQNESKLLVIATMRTREACTSIWIWMMLILMMAIVVVAVVVVRAAVAVAAQRCRACDAANAVGAGAWNCRPWMRLSMSPSKYFRFISDMVILDTWCLKLVVKGSRIALENGVTGGFNRIGVQGGIVTSDALALGAARRGRRKRLAVQLQTTV
jgi:hypothetical protein